AKEVLFEEHLVRLLGDLAAAAARFGNLQILLTAMNNAPFNGIPTEFAEKARVRAVKMFIRHCPTSSIPALFTEVKLVNAERYLSKFVGCGVRACSLSKVSEVKVALGHGGEQVETWW